MSCTQAPTCTFSQLFGVFVHGNSCSSGVYSVGYVPGVMRVTLWEPALPVSPRGGGGGGAAPGWGRGMPPAPGWGGTLEERVTYNVCGSRGAIITLCRVVVGSGRWEEEGRWTSHCHVGVVCSLINAVSRFWLGLLLGELGQRMDLPIHHAIWPSTSSTAQNWAMALRLFHYYICDQYFIFCHGFSFQETGGKCQFKKRLFCVGVEW